MNSNFKDFFRTSTTSSISHLQYRQSNSFRTIDSESSSSNNDSKSYEWSTSNRTPIGLQRRRPLYDPNYSLTSASTSGDQSLTVMCVTEGTGVSKGTIGMAVIDVYRPFLQLSQFTDNVNYELLRNKLIGFQPIIVLIPNTFIKNESRLLELINSQLESTHIQGLDRKHFNDAEGTEMIRKLQCDDYSLIEIQLKSKYYCLSACAALLKYLETIQNQMFAPKSLRIEFKGSDNTMFIDPTTAKLLELIVNLNDPKSLHSVLGTINRTKTRSGYRLLRSNLLQPSTDRKLIERRHHMIETIVSSQSLFEGLEAILLQFSGIEVERVISSLVQLFKSSEPDVKSAERKIGTVIIVKHIISLIEPLIETLSLCETDVFQEFIEILSDERFAHIMLAINEIISEDCKFSKGSHSMRMEKCSAIKKGVNSLLDIARDAYSETIDDVFHLVNDIRQYYKEELPLSLTYTTNRGYHMEIVVKGNNKREYSFPQGFIKIIYNKKTINFTTQELINKNNRINSATEEIYLMSDGIITDLIKKIREFIGCLYNLSEVIAKIDLVFSFASQCSVANYVRPNFSDYMVVKQGRHPVLENVINKKPVPNDIFMSEDNNFMVITGPNMSGKTTLLKQVAIHQVMAQIGSYIPAEFAIFKIFDKLFSRIGNNDEIESNSSTFMVEMREMSYILRNMSDKSLVIIDELGRGTSVEEGVSICFAISEHLLKTSAFTLIATHFIELTKLENFYLNVSNRSFGVEHQSNGTYDESYVFTYILESGPTKELLYGLRLAYYTAIEPSILAKAHQFAQRLQDNQTPAIISNRLNQNQRIYYELTSTLLTMLKDGQFPDTEVLIQMQTYYRNQIEANSSRPTTDSRLTDEEISDLGNDFQLI